MEARRLLGATAALGLLAALTGCGAGSGGAQEATGGPSRSASAAPSSSASAAGAGSAVGDVCALLPADRLRAAIGADPGEGTAAEGRIDGGQCTWKVSDAHTVLVQVTRQPDVHLPASVWKRPASAADVPGVDRGWAAAETHTILLVKGGRGVLFSDVGFSGADQSAYDALAAAIAARL